MSIQIEQVSISYGPVRALESVDLNVADGSLTALLGPSGCGKTTLLRAIAGFETIDRGRILLDGRDAKQLSLAARGVGFVFQQYALFPHLSVEANIAFSLSVRKVPRERIARRVAELIDLVQLAGYAKRRPHELSGGQRQRVALARALAAEPRYLLLDEPFGALDFHVRRDLRAWLRDLHDRTHVTTLLVTHDSDEAMEIADEIVLLREGVVQQHGRPDDLYRRPVNPFVMRFLGDVNVAGDRYVRPSDVRIARERRGSAVPATVSSIHRLGPRTRLEVRLEDGTRVFADLDRDDAATFAESAGETVYVELANPRIFEGAAATL